MALNARAISSSPTSNVTSGHMPSGGRNVAPVSFGQIEEIVANANVQPDPNFNFQGSYDGHGGQPQPQEPLRNVGGNVDTDSSTFVSLLHQGQDSQERSNPVGQVKGAFHGLLSRAIRAYEGTAAVIHGTVPQRGASYSTTL